MSINRRAFLTALGVGISAVPAMPFGQGGRPLAPGEVRGAKPVGATASGAEGRDRKAVQNTGWPSECVGCDRGRVLDRRAGDRSSHLDGHQWQGAESVPDRVPQLQRTGSRRRLPVALGERCGAIRSADQNRQQQPGDSAMPHGRHCREASRRSRSAAAGRPASSMSTARCGSSRPACGRSCR